jgi:hypothetical protein
VLRRLVGLRKLVGGAGPTPAPTTVANPPASTDQPTS